MMKRYMTFFVGAFLLAASSASATTFQETFYQANDLYKEGKFSKAYELYEKIPNKSAKVHYNLGNCAFKLNKIGYF